MKQYSSNNNGSWNGRVTVRNVNQGDRVSTDGILTHIVPLIAIGLAVAGIVWLFVNVL